MPALTCPYCTAKANFTMCYEWDEAMPTGNTIRYAVWVCDSCHRPERIGLEAQRLITPQMREVAHTIRLAGNLGAHPDKDGLRDVGEPEAQAVMEFLDDFLKYVYEIPTRLERLKGASSQ